jgi:hypothetical protein
MNCFPKFFSACALALLTQAAFAQSGPTLPALGAASGFAVLGASTVTCTNASTVTGDVGVSPGTAITGFNPDCTTTGTIHAGDAVAAQAHNDLVTAYNDVKAVACQYNFTGQDLGGKTLAPGVYCFDSSVGLTGQLTLDGGGNSNAVWIFQIGSTITTATDSSVVMAGGGQACNAFWQVGSSATIGTGTQFKGNLLALASITLVSGANVVGRALAVNAAVTMDHNNVSTGNCASAPGSGQSCSERVTGGGYIKTGHGNANFGVTAGIRNGAFRGHLTYIDHGKNLKVKGTGVTMYQVIDAKTRHIEGTAMINGAPGTYKVDLTDNGKGGKKDSFKITLSKDNYSESGDLAGGNIQLHKRHCDKADTGHHGHGQGDDHDDDDHDDDEGDHGDDHGDHDKDHGKTPKPYGSDDKKRK